MKKNKVIGIGIGFHKTGTTTLGVALTELGYNVLGGRVDLAPYLLSNDIEPVLKITEEYDAFQDNPWPLLYREFDKKYPSCKFILTIRENSKWIRSVVNHFGMEHTEMRRWIYGIGHPKGSERIYLEKYIHHNDEVLKYFCSRPDDLLAVNWEDGAGWKELCAFLNEPLPDKPFPHANRGKDFKKKYDDSYLVSDAPADRPV